MSATLYRFKLAVSDVDRAYYDTLEVRVAMHPSESEVALLTRVLAYALNYEVGLEFSPGLSTPDEAAIRLPGANGKMSKWIDIGNPSPRRIHKASKASERVCIYTYKDPENLKREAQGERIHRAELIQVFAIRPSFLQSLALQLKRDNSWAIVHNEGELIVSIGGESLMTTIDRHSFDA